MRKEVKEDWVADLRSGKYIQGKGELITDQGRFCVLGVLFKRYVTIHGLSVCPWEKEGDLLPKEVNDWAGFDEDNPMLKHSTMGNQRLACLNDLGVPFNELADLINDQL